MLTTNHSEYTGRRQWRKGHPPRQTQGCRSEMRGQDRLVEFHAPARLAGDRQGAVYELLGRFEQTITPVYLTPGMFECKKIRNSGA